MMRILEVDNRPKGERYNKDDELYLTFVGLLTEELHGLLFNNMPQADRSLDIHASVDRPPEETAAGHVRADIRPGQRSTVPRSSKKN